MSEGSRHFEGRSQVQQALTKITSRLKEIGVSYVVVGGMAFFLHGYRRFTEAVDLLVTAEGLKKLHEALEGLGYVPPFAGSKQLRDTEFGVKIEFLVTGGFPGDGKPKAVAFPDPADVGEEKGGVRVLVLPKLIELKLASGMSSPGRLRDLADVLELIKVARLGAGFAEELEPSVREKFLELVRAAAE